MTSTISAKVKAGYSVGHVLNDLCAAMWFSYLLVYFHQILTLDAATAGYLLLIGQITDGMATPCVGLESDRVGIFGRLYGRRKSWHLFGTLCVILSFIFIFTPVPQYIPDVTPEWVALVYYTPFIVIFQIGWASTQVSHLSVIPNLTAHAAERTQLNSFRYAGTVLSSIAVYGIAFGFLESSDTDTLGWDDRYSFQYLAIIVISMGSMFSLMFHLLVPEAAEIIDEGTGSRTDDGDNVSGNEGTPLIYQEPAEETIKSWTEWFRQPNFYLTGVIYMSSRLIVNMSQVYMPFYLTDSLGAPKSMIAIVPLIVFISGFFMSMSIPFISKKINHNFIYICGTIVLVAGFIWARYLAIPIGGLDPSRRYEIIGVAVLNGAGCAAVLISSLSLTSLLIGDNLSTSAFVYGAMSLTDKFANGIAVVIIQNNDPCSCHCEKCGKFFRDVLTIGVSSICVVASIAVLGHYFLYGRPPRQPQYEVIDD